MAHLKTVVVNLRTQLSLLLSNTLLICLVVSSLVLYLNLQRYPLGLLMKQTY